MKTKLPITRRNALKALAMATTGGPVLGALPAVADARDDSQVWVDEKLKTAKPEEISGPLINPYMGWGIWAGPRYFDGRAFTLEYNTTGFGDDAPLFGWLLIDWMWSDLEPQEGQYHWDELDAIINYWAQRHKQVELRVWITDDPGWDRAPGNKVCPDWLWNDGVHYHEYMGLGHTKKREPAYADPSYERIYIPKARRFLTALTERYDKPNGPVFLWGCMGYGQWGEWHTLVSHYAWPNEDVKHRVLAKVVNMYADVFRNHQLSISYCIDHDNDRVKNLKDFMYRQALDVAVADDFALARHGFIDGLDHWDDLFMQKYWRRQPMWAEGDWSYTEMKDQGTHGTFNENLDIMLAWHSNYAHFYMDADSYKRAMREDRPSHERGLQAGGLGYRLVLTDAAWKDELHAGDLLLLRQRWVNRNAGRLYKQFPLKLYLIDANGNERYSEIDRGFDQTAWIAGVSYPVISVFHLPKDLTPSVYEMYLALVDSEGNPHIWLGISGKDGKGRYKLGTVRILPLRSKPRK